MTPAVGRILSNCQSILSLPLLWKSRRRICLVFEEAWQIKHVVYYFNNMPEIKRENWINLSFEERVKVIQKIETPAAKVGCRPALTVETAPMNTNNYDYMNWGRTKNCY